LAQLNQKLKPAINFVVENYKRALLNFFEKVYGDQLHKFQTLFFISRIRERFFGLWPQNDTFSLSF